MQDQSVVPTQYTKPEDSIRAAVEARIAAGLVFVQGSEVVNLILHGLQLPECKLPCGCSLMPLRGAQEGPLTPPSVSLCGNGTVACGQCEKTLTAVSLNNSPPPAIASPASAP
jgi:hypothetical protein